MAASRFALINETKATLPRVAFRAIKEAILGKAYRLNTIVAAPARMKALNTIYRDKTKPTDILSFPLSDGEGEIYLCPTEARKEAKKFGRPYGNFIAFLFIHGCVHLKGYDHGSRMEKLEERYRRRFKI
ncbi:MAG: rRNA maturation RNase YbeY [Patescibacteria group bacterium]|nr:rRNA maturation RNase YbeY [Patescibacteria group bacterium]MDE1940859.1 rRNA maturation RNase YbeY [Patescibacteria group bacterium]MDE1966452.1 rRNA maturation RNase YbeY [Patescibacteria group bacterium]